MATDLVIPAIRMEQKGRVCYLGTMTAEQSAIFTFADSYPPDESEGKLGYQRAPNERRAKDFASYLSTFDSAYMTPILLNSRVPVDYTPSATNPATGTIRVRAGTRLAKIDGQHRGIGVERYLGDPGFPVPFMLFDNLPADAEQELFISINREQKRVAMSHVLFVNAATGQQDLHTDLALRLNEDHSSPWHRRINVIGATGSGKTMTLQGVKEGLDLLLAHPKVRVLPDDAKYAVAREFWSAVADTWPEAWQQPRLHILTKTIGHYGIAKSGSFVVASCLTGSEDPEQVIDVRKLRQILSIAAGVDWSSGGQFAGLGGRGGADRISMELDGYFVGALS